MIHEPERWKADYERDGYLVVRDVVDPDLLGRLRAGIDEITRDPDSLPDRLKRYLDFERNYVKAAPHMNEYSSAEVGNALRNIMELPLFSPLFAEFILHAPLLDVLETLFASSEFSFHNYKCIVKAPRVSSRFRWHRDLPYLFHTTPDLITAMICLDDMTSENGGDGRPARIAPGTAGGRHPRRRGHPRRKASARSARDGDLPGGVGGALPREHHPRGRGEQVGGTAEECDRDLGGTGNVPGESEPLGMAGTHAPFGRPGTATAGAHELPAPGRGGRSHIGRDAVIGQGIHLYQYERESGGRTLVRRTTLIHAPTMRSTVADHQPCRVPIRASTSTMSPETMVPAAAPTIAPRSPPAPLPMVAPVMSPTSGRP